MQRVVSVCLAIIVPALLTMAHAAPDAELNQVLQQAYADCKTAHVLRRRDLVLAKETYARYQAIRDQQAGPDAGFLESADQEVARIIGYCETVGNDIARTEALPVIQQGIEACGSAAESLQKGDAKAARRALKSFEELKDRAVGIAPFVLDVYSVMSGVRRCERVAAEIESLFRRQQAQTSKLAEITGHLDNVLTSCEAIEIPEDPIVVAEVEDPVAVASSLTDTTGALREQLAASEQALAETPGQEFLAAESMQEPEFLETTAKTTDAIKACQDKLVVAIANADKMIEELQAEQAGREAAEAAAAAEQLANQQETPEDRRKRLEKNAELYTLVKRVVPEFPRSKKRSEKGNGYVLLEYTIGVDGSVIDPVVIDSKGGKSFNKAALKAIKQWEYEPGFGEDAEPEAAVMRTQFSFALR